MSRRVVVTGVGAVSPIGESVDTFWENALAGKSGVGRITLFDPSDFLTQIGAEVSDWDPEKYMPRRESRRLDRSAQFFVVATDQAMADAGLAYEEDDPRSASGRRRGRIRGRRSSFNPGRDPHHG